MTSLCVYVCLAGGSPPAQDRRSSMLAGKVSPAGSPLTIKAGAASGAGEAAAVASGAGNPLAAAGDDTTLCVAAATGEVAAAGPLVATGSSSSPGVNGHHENGHHKSSSPVVKDNGGLGLETYKVRTLKAEVVTARASRPPVENKTSYSMRQQATCPHCFKTVLTMPSVHAVRGRHAYAPGLLPWAEDCACSRSCSSPPSPPCLQPRPRPACLCRHRPGPPPPRQLLLLLAA